MKLKNLGFSKMMLGSMLIPLLLLSIVGANLASKILELEVMLIESESVAKFQRFNGVVDMYHDGLMGRMYQMAYFQQKGDVDRLEVVRSETRADADAMREALTASQSILDELGIESTPTAVKMVDAYVDLVEQAAEGRRSVAELLGPVNTQFDVLVAVLEGRATEAENAFDKRIYSRIASIERVINTMGVFAAIILVITIMVAIWMYKRLLSQLGDEPESLVSAVGQIAQGNYDVSLPENGASQSLSRSISQMLQSLRASREQAVENARVRQALDGTSVNVMIADNERNIIYMNKSVQAMLRETENDLRSALPNFRADRLLGENMDVFHKNPAHQSNLLANLKTTYEANIVVGKLHFRLTANPIHDEQGKRIGSVVEWLDRTAEVKAEQEIQTLVDAAVAGDFSQRLPEGNKQGFMLNMTKGLNRIVSDAEQGLKDIERIMSAMAQGDLTQRIEADYQGMFNQIKNAANDTTTNLSRMIGEIREAVDTINTASAEIASGNSDLSSRTEQQAANLEETASSMEELTGTVRLNADNAGQATGLASKASTVAVEGGELIDKVVGTMASINESAQKISDIIGVIDGIAFQTNILALNAAVEAARAGDQGRGFAVVASEVRSLAQRSANAAKDIKALISDSVQKIADGNGLVNQSGNTMKEIVTSIKRVNDIMAEIAAASAEQASGIDEIGKAVTQMDEMTQQNAALVEEAAAAAESLQSQSDQLAARVATFRISGMVSGAELAPSRVPQLGASRRAATAPPRLSKNASTGKSSLATRHSASQDDEWEDF